MEDIKIFFAEDSEAVEQGIKMEESYFDNLNAIDLASELKNTFPELQNINNWVQVY